ncbi:MAG: tryptophan 2,3-dioxygenase family protein [Pseudomonadota bacterium]|jgi:Tryptophan 2,3-dioxygenase (vermilion)|nr:MAG: tryptophan 2,3-dioxygenase [Pseudomonadota bacterium]
MDRLHFYTELGTFRGHDYEVYLDTAKLLSCQKPFEALCNGDELQFQIVHQVEELWMKLLAYTLLDVDECLEKAESFRAITLFRRCHLLLKLMTEQLALLETMSPKEYQQIRLQLGNGSGQESPGFRVLMQMPPHLWRTYEAVYLKGRGRTIEQVYDSQYTHDDAYAIAECLAELDELFQKFRWHHILLIHRSIGPDAASLKGRPVELLERGARHRFFPQLWEVRSKMTDAWGSTYGRVRERLTEEAHA